MGDRSREGGDIQGLSEGHRGDPLGVELDEVMGCLAAKRRAFHSEADLQFSLAWEIQRCDPGCHVRLEYPFALRRDGRRVYLDIWVRDGGSSHAIELKYKTRPVRERYIDGDEFVLADQSAQDIARHAFLNDVCRLEAVARESPDVRGHALFLTNDRTYWVEPGKAEPVDLDFRLTEGRVVEGVLRWGEGASDTLRNGRGGLELEGSYRLRWRDFSRVDASTYGAFRYLLVDVG